MFDPQELLTFGLIAFTSAATPGPNMVYCVSRSLVQGRHAGLLSLAGVLLGYGAHLAAIMLGLTALLHAVPGAFDALRYAGALYLLWIAWQALRQGGRLSPKATVLPRERPLRVLRMGLLICLLNPVVALFNLSLLPQFLHPEHGALWLQCLMLGTLHVSAAAFTLALLVLGAARGTVVLSRNRGWARAQHCVMATVLGLLALRLLLPVGTGGA